jgi:hypothetical protein
MLSIALVSRVIDNNSTRENKKIILKNIVTLSALDCSIPQHPIPDRHFELFQVAQLIAHFWELRSLQLSNCQITRFPVTVLMTHANPFRAVAYSYFIQECGCPAKAQERQVMALVDEFLRFGHPSASEVSARISAIIGHPVEFIDRLQAILSVPDDPLSRPPVRSDDLKQKTNPWMRIEDARLLAGIRKFGLDHWVTVAEFVGHGRTRSQCSQRWYRCLDPRLNKSAWTPEEERKLQSLVEKYGLKSWTKIAQQMETRSDVQCRYHYLRGQTKNKQPAIQMDATPVETKGTREPGSAKTLPVTESFVCALSTFNATEETSPFDRFF